MGAIVTTMGGMLSTLIALSLLGPTAQEPAADLTWETYEQVRGAVMPKPGELGWLEVDWRPELWSAIAEARDADKPLLIWAMNGHPLACT